MSLANINAQAYIDHEIELKRLPKPAYLIKTRPAADIVQELNKGNMWLKIATVAAFIATAFFVIRYFVGGNMDVAAWDSESWINAGLGLAIASIITIAQSMLYSSGYGGTAAIAGTVLLLFFNFFTDISQSMERGDDIVKTRSQESPVFQEALKSIGTVSQINSAPIANPYAAQLAEAEGKLSTCLDRLAKGKETTCVKSQGRVDSLKAQSAASMTATSSTNATALTNAINQAKGMEYDENNQYAMIRLLKDFLGVTGLFASFLFSLIIIGTFEYAFHFIGEYVSDRKRALMLLGIDHNGNPLDPDGSDPTGKTRSRPTPSTTATTTSNLTGNTSSTSTGTTAQLDTADLKRQLDDIRNTWTNAKSLLAAPAALPVNVTNLTEELAKRRLSPAPTSTQTAQNLTGSGLTVSPTEPYSKPAPTSKPSPVSPISSKPTPVSPAPSKPSTAHDNAIATLWRSIDNGTIKRVSYPQCKNRLKLDGITSDNDQAQQLTSIALDALEREWVVMINPKYDASTPQGGFDKYIIRRDYTRQPTRWSTAGEVTA